MVFLKANKEGHVSEIHMITSFKNTFTIKVMAEIFSNIFATLGMTPQEAKMLINQLEKNKNLATQFCYKTNRYIVMASDVKDSTTVIFYLAAYVI